MLENHSSFSFHFLQSFKLLRRLRLIFPKVLIICWIIMVGFEAYVNSFGQCNILHLCLCFRISILTRTPYIQYSFIILSLVLTWMLDFQLLYWAWLQRFMFRGRVNFALYNFSLLSDVHVTSLSSKIFICNRKSHSFSLTLMMLEFFYFCFFSILDKVYDKERMHLSGKWINNLEYLMLYKTWS